MRGRKKKKKSCHEVERRLDVSKNVLDIKKEASAFKKCVCRNIPIVPMLSLAALVHSAHGYRSQTMSQLIR